MKLLSASIFPLLSSAVHWPGFRGPNGSDVSDFNESECRAIPAIAAHQLYSRPHSALYAFGKKV